MGGKNKAKILTIHELATKPIWRLGGLFRSLSSDEVSSILLSMKNLSAQEVEESIGLCRTIEALTYSDRVEVSKVARNVLHNGKSNSDFLPRVSLEKRLECLVPPCASEFGVLWDPFILAFGLLTLEDLERYRTDVLPSNGFPEIDKKYQRWKKTQLGEFSLVVRFYLYGTQPFETERVATTLARTHFCASYVQAHCYRLDFASKAQKRWLLAKVAASSSRLCETEPERCCVCDLGKGRVFSEFQARPELEYYSRRLRKNLATIYNASSQQVIAKAFITNELRRACDCEDHPAHQQAILQRREIEQTLSMSHSETDVEECISLIRDSGVWHGAADGAMALLSDLGGVWNDSDGERFLDSTIIQPLSSKKCKFALLILIGAKSISRVPLQRIPGTEFQYEEIPNSCDCADCEAAKNFLMNVNVGAVHLPLVSCKGCGERVCDACSHVCDGQLRSSPPSRCSLQSKLGQGLETNVKEEIDQANKEARAKKTLSQRRTPCCVAF